MIPLTHIFIIGDLPDNVIRKEHLSYVRIDDYFKLKQIILHSWKYNYDNNYILVKNKIMYLKNFYEDLYTYEKEVDFDFLLKYLKDKEEDYESDSSQE